MYFLRASARSVQRASSSCSRQLRTRRALLTAHLRSTLGRTRADGLRHTALSAQPLPISRRAPTRRRSRLATRGSHSCPMARAITAFITPFRATTATGSPGTTGIRRNGRSEASRSPVSRGGCAVRQRRRSRDAGRFRARNRASARAALLRRRRGISHEAFRRGRQARVCYRKTGAGAGGGSSPRFPLSVGYLGRIVPAQRAQQHLLSLDLAVSRQHLPSRERLLCEVRRVFQRALRALDCRPKR